MYYSSDVYYSIDRFEGDVAVIERDGCTIDVSRALLPPNAVPGDVIISGSDGRFLSAPEETARRREYVLELQRKLLQKKKNGDEL